MPELVFTIAEPEPIDVRSLWMVQVIGLLPVHETANAYPCIQGDRTGTDNEQVTY